MLAAFVLPAPITGILDQTYLQNSLKTWLTALLTAAVILLLGLVLRRLLIVHVGDLAARTTVQFDDMIFELLKQTRTWVIVCIAVFVGTSFLVLPPRVGAFIAPAMKLVLLWQAAVWGGATVAFWVQVHLTRRTGTHDRTSVAMVSAMGVAARALIWVLIVLTAMKSVFNIEITALITGLGVGGIAVALAVQNILGDILAALAIVFDKPFDVGDFITLDNVAGTVEHIGLKTTRVRSLSGEQVVLGNADLLKSRLHNYRSMTKRRVVFTTNVTYDTPPDTLERLPGIVKQIVESQKPVTFDRSHVANLADSWISIETVYYVLDADYTRYMNIQQAITLDILRQFTAAGAKFAFPSRSLYIETVPPTTTPESTPRPPRSTAP